MPADRDDPADQNSGDTGSSSWINGLPRGKIGRDQLTSDSAGTTSTEVILSDTITVVDGREIDIDASVCVRSDIDGGAQAAIIFDGTQVDRKNNESVTANKDISWSLFAQVQPAAGTYVVEVVTGVSGAAGNTVTAKANGTTGSHGVCKMRVLDQGPAL